MLHTTHWEWRSLRWRYSWFSRFVRLFTLAVKLESCHVGKRKRELKTREITGLLFQGQGTCCVIQSRDKTGYTLTIFPKFWLNITTFTIYCYVNICCHGEEDFPLFGQLKLLFCVQAKYWLFPHAKYDIGWHPPPPFCSRILKVSVGWWIEPMYA